MKKGIIMRVSPDFFKMVDIKRKTIGLEHGIKIKSTIDFTKALASPNLFSDKKLTKALRRKLW